MSQSQHKYGMETKLSTTFNWQSSQNYSSHKRRGVNAYIDTKYTLTLQKAWVPICTTVKHALSVFILCRKFSATNSYKKSMVWHDINTKEVLKPKVNLEIRFLDLSPLSSSLLLISSSSPRAGEVDGTAPTLGFWGIFWTCCTSEGEVRRVALKCPKKCAKIY